MRRSFAISAVFALLLACAAPAGAGQIYRLQSGAQIEILKMGPIAFSDGQKAIALQYGTQTSLDALERLTKEVNEVWNSFVFDAERGKYKRAVISARTKSGAERNFAFHKRDESWRMLEPDNAKTLTRASIAAYYERTDWLTKQKASNALLLYLADDFAMTLSGKLVGPKPVTLNREQYALAMHESFKVTEEYQVSRKITAVKIFDKGRKARVVSTVSENVLSNGQRLRTVSRTVDILELRDGSVVALKCDAVIEVQSVASRDAPAPAAG